MQQDKNIQNKLQQLENQQLPDLSQMDAHWQKMQEMLQPTAPTPGKVINISRWVYIIAATAIIITSIVLITKNKTGKQAKEIASETTKEKIITTQVNQNTNQAIVNTINKDTSINNNLPISNYKQSGIAALSLKKGKSLSNAKRSANRNDSPGGNEFGVKPVNSDSTTTLKAIVPNRQEMLDNLLSELAKTAQEFMIDNRRDTLLVGSEGGILLIPANSLGGGSGIKISLKEYYKSSDIVLNKLSTTSNGQQLETGGMVHIEATENNKPVELKQGTSIRLYLPDTSTARMKDMQLFNGTKLKDDNINWIPQGQKFFKSRIVTEVKVLDIRNEPFKTVETRNGTTGYFEIADDSKLSRKELRKTLKEKYGYNKIKFKNSWSNRKFVVRAITFNKIAYRDSYRGIGDSIWMEISVANKYGLKGTATKTYEVNNIGYNYNIWDNGGLFGNGRRIKGKRDNNVPGGDSIRTDNFDFSYEDVKKELTNRYSVNLNKLGWINCDRFTGRSDLIRYAVNFNDSSSNYYTLLVFDNIKSMMTGYLEGNKVVFNNVPLNEPVKVISIGINKEGETVIAMKEVKISQNELRGLVFEPTTKNNLLVSLSKIDK